MAERDPPSVTVVTDMCLESTLSKTVAVTKITERSTTGKFFFVFFLNLYVLSLNTVK